MGVTTTILFRLLSPRVKVLKNDHNVGLYVWDQEGNKYMDFLAAYSAVN